MPRAADPKSGDAHPPPALSPKFCARFHAVCVACPHVTHAGLSRPSETISDFELPPFADRAIEALARCRGLTQREREVLTLCCSGQKNSTIAAVLGISVSAVRRHLRNLHKKTNTADKAELILNLWHSCEIPRHLAS